MYCARNRAGAADVDGDAASPATTDVQGIAASCVADAAGARIAEGSKIAWCPKGHRQRIGVLVGGNRSIVGHRYRRTRKRRDNIEAESVDGHAGIDLTDDAGVQVLSLVAGRGIWAHGIGCRCCRCVRRAGQRDRICSGRCALRQSALRLHEEDRQNADAQRRASGGWRMAPSRYQWIRRRSAGWCQSHKTRHRTIPLGQQQLLGAAPSRSPFVPLRGARLIRSTFS